MLCDLNKLIDYYFKRNVYYCETYNSYDIPFTYIYDIKNRICFNVNTNEYYNFYFKEYFLSGSEGKYSLKNKKISKEEYNKLHKNEFCDCRVGSGKPNVKTGKEYDLIKEFNDYNVNKDLYIYVDMYIDKTIVIVKSKKNSLKYTMDKKAYYKRACLKCNKCLSDYNEMINYFDKIIKYFEDYDKVNEICGNI